MKKQTSMMMLLVVIGAMLLSGCINQSDNGDRVALAGDKNIPTEDNKIDPASERAPVARISEEVAGKEVPEDTSGEVGYTGTDYPIDDIPAIIVPPSHREDLKNFQILNLRYENGKIKFCIKDSTTAHSGYGPKISLSVNDCSIQKFPIDVPKNKIVCYETHYDIRDYGAIDVPDYLCVRITG